MSALVFSIDDLIRLAFTAAFGGIALLSALGRRRVRLGRLDEEYRRLVERERGRTR